MHLIYGSLFILVAFKSCNWKELKNYYSTFLFLSFWDLIYQFLLYNHEMWVYHPSFDNWLLPNHTMIVLFWMFTIYPSLILMFLSRFPVSGKLKKVAFFLLWTSILGIIEIFSLYGWNGITHHNGWNIYWSLVLDVALLISLKLHQWKPYYAWIFGCVFTLGFWMILNVPFNVLK